MGRANKKLAVSCKAMLAYQPSIDPRYRFFPLEIFQANTLLALDYVGADFLCCKHWAPYQVFGTYRMLGSKLPLPAADYFEGQRFLQNRSVLQ